MNIKIVAGIVVMAVLVLGAFYGGTVYAKKSSSAIGQFSNTQFMGGQRGMGMRSGMNGGGFTSGEIISKDASGITLKMQNGSTKIVLIGESSYVTKSVAGSVADLTVGINISVTGITNSDGSVTAQSVQIRPAELVKTN